MPKLGINIYWERFKTPQERFWSRVDKSGGEDSCWNWIAAKDKNGYGNFRCHYKEKEQRSHRHAWVFTNGKIPESMCVLHKCDNPSCCNPKHLFIGTNLDNMLDKTRKGRNNAPVGERAGLTKLTEKQVLEMREMFASGLLTQRAIAKKFSVGYKAVNKIVHRQRWKHI